MQTKVCTKCHVEQPIDNYYVTAGYADGHHTWCKTCHKAYYRERYKRNRSLFQERVAEYKRRNPDKAREIQQRGHDKEKQSPEKLKARRAVRLEVDMGRMPSPKSRPCRACGKKAQVYHHWSYAQEHWLDVIPMCSSCHRRLHVGDLPVDIPVPDQ